MLLANAAATTALYAAWKLLLRQRVGCTPDARGWGIETYLSAFVHQLATAALGMWLVASQADVDAWLAAPWSDTPESQRLEQFFLLMQAAEMATDVVRDRAYPGFGQSYMSHHLATLAASLAALVLSVPVGGVVAFGALMEGGGAALNAVSLYAPAMAALRPIAFAADKSPLSRRGMPKPPAWLLDMRVLLYAGSRLAAGAVLARTTRAALLLSPPPWAAIVAAWAILAVNTPWVLAMVRSLLDSWSGGGRADAMAAFCK